MVLCTPWWMSQIPRSAGGTGAALDVNAVLTTLGLGVGLVQVMQSHVLQARAIRWTGVVFLVTIRRSPAPPNKRSESACLRTLMQRNKEFAFNKGYQVPRSRTRGGGLQGPAQLPSSCAHRPLAPARTFCVGHATSSSRSFRCKQFAKPQGKHQQSWGPPRGSCKILIELRRYVLSIS